MTMLMAPEGAEDWRSSLPDDLKGEAMFKDIPDVGTLAKVARDLKAFQGTALRPPGPEADAAAHRDFAERLAKGTKGIVYVPDDEKLRGEVEPSIWEKLGRPKEAKDYVADDTGLDDERLEALRKEALDTGLTKAQFAKVAKRVAEAGKAQSAAAAAQAKELKDAFGEAYDARMKEVAAVAEKTGAPKSVRDAIAKGSIDKETASYFLAVGKQLGVDTREVAGQRTQGPSGVSKKEAESRVAEIMRNPDFFKPGPMQEALQAKLIEYQAIVHPDLVER
jgi:hypothetical protein